MQPVLWSGSKHWLSVLVLSKFFAKTVQKGFYSALHSSGIAGEWGRVCQGFPSSSCLPGWAALALCWLFWIWTNFILPWAPDNGNIKQLESGRWLLCTASLGLAGFGQLRFCSIERQLSCCGADPGSSLALLLVPKARLFPVLEASQGISASKK